MMIQRVVEGETYCDPSITNLSPESGGKRCEEMGPPDSALTARQTDILRLIGEGRNTKEIASVLRISGKTVDFHRLRLMARLKTGTIAGLVREAIRRGLIGQV